MDKTAQTRADMDVGLSIGAKRGSFVTQKKRTRGKASILLSVCVWAFMTRAVAGLPRRCYDGPETQKLALIMKVTKDACPTQFSHLGNLMDPYMQVHTCTGVLVAPQVVVAPASCVNRPGYSLPLVRVGSYDLTKQDGNDQEELIGVCQARVHANFKGDPEEGDDIALPLLKTPATVHKPVSGVRSRADCNGGSLNAFGWFRIDASGTPSSILQVAENMTYIQREICEQVFDRLPDHVICAEMALGHGTPWDQGAALLCDDEDLVGILIHTILKAGKRRPYVFLQISDYHEWIIKLGRGESTSLNSSDDGCAQVIEEMNTMELNFGPGTDGDDKACNQEADSMEDKGTCDQPK